VNRVDADVEAIEADENVEDEFVTWVGSFDGFMSLMVLVRVGSGKK
jgi:hypothetical protein